MAVSEWEGTKEEICAHLQMGGNKGELQLDTITRLICMERQKHADLCNALKTIQSVSRAALQRERGVVAKHASLLKWRKPRNKTKSISIKSDKPAISSGFKQWPGTRANPQSEHIEPPVA